MPTSKTRVITLPTAEPWFSKLLSGEKKEEYREFKDYYISRFANYAGISKEKFSELLTSGNAGELPVYNVIFRNGYAEASPTFHATGRLRYGTGKKEWGAKKGKKYIVFMVQEVKPHIKQEPEQETSDQCEVTIDTKAEFLPFIGASIGDLEIQEDGKIKDFAEHMEAAVYEIDYGEALKAKEWLDDFLTIPKVGDECDYGAMEKYDEYHFGKAKMYVQTLYDIIMSTKKNR